MTDRYAHVQSIVVDQRSVVGDATSVFRVNVDSAHVGQRLRAVYVKKVALTNNFFNIVAGSNRFYWFSDAANRSLLVPPGNWTFAALAAWLQMTLESLPGVSVEFSGGSIEVSAITGRVNFDGTAAGTPILFGSDTLRATFPNEPSSVNELLGVGTADQNFLSTPLPNPADLSGEKFMMLVCERIASGSAALTTAGAHDLGLLATVPLTGGFGQKVIYEVPQQDTALVNVSAHSSHDVRTLQFRIVDVRGVPMVLPQNSQFAFELVCLYH